MYLVESLNLEKSYLSLVIPYIKQKNLDIKCTRKPFDVTVSSVLHIYSASDRLGLLTNFPSFLRSQARSDQQLNVTSAVEENRLCLPPGLLALTSGKCCISSQTKAFKVLCEMLTSCQRFECQVLQTSKPLWSSALLCARIGSNSCLGLQMIGVWPYSEWCETGCSKRGESNPPSGSCHQQGAGSFPCLVVTSPCEAILRIASVFIGK